MDKRCRVCTAKFGIFKKEVECNRCHIALCKDCRSQTLQEGQNTLAVCKKCFTAVTTGATQPRPRSPPLNFKREMEAKRQAAEASSSSSSSYVSPPKPGELNDEDLQIAARLDKLIQETSKDTSVSALEARLSKLSADERVATQQEIEYRLAKLKGDRPPVVKVLSVRKKSQSAQVPNTSTKADTPDKEAKRLIRQYTEEVLMDSEHNMQTDENFDPENIPEEPTADQIIALAQEALRREQDQQAKDEEVDQEMQERLKKLHGMSPYIDCNPIHPMEHTTSFELSDEEEDKLIKKLTDEAALEVSLGTNRSSTKPSKKSSSQRDTKPVQSTSEEDKDELPWCCICNEDATLRCHGCEGDLYCRRCFKEGHDKFDLKEHKTIKYNKPHNMDYD